MFLYSTILGSICFAISKIVPNTLVHNHNYLLPSPLPEFSNMDVIVLPGIKYMRVKYPAYVVPSEEIILGPTLYLQNTCTYIFYFIAHAVVTAHTRYIINI